MVLLSVTKSAPTLKSDAIPFTLNEIVGRLSVTVGLGSGVLLQAKRVQMANNPGKTEFKKIVRMVVGLKMLLKAFVVCTTMDQN